MTIQFDPKNFEVAAEKLHELARGHVEWIEHCIGDGDHDTWIPQLMVFTRDPKQDFKETMTLCSLAVDFNESWEKENTLQGVAKRFWRDRLLPVALVMSSECWVNQRKPDEPHIEPRHDPNRREAISVFGTTVGGKANCHASMPITRRRGKIVPARFGELLIEGIKAPILNAFWRGFFNPVIAKRN